MVLVYVPSQNASVGPAGPCPPRIFSYCITHVYYCRSAEWQATESRARPRPGQATAARSARSRWLLPRAVHPSRLSRRVGVACASRRRAARPRSPVPRRRTNRIPRPVVSRPTMATRSYALQRAGALRLVVAPVLKEVPRLIPLGLGPWEGAHGVC